MGGEQDALENGLLVGLVEGGDVAHRPNAIDYPLGCSRVLVVEGRRSRQRKPCLATA